MRLLILTLVVATQCFGGWGRYIHHTPAPSQVSGGPHANFPSLIDVTHNDLRVTGSGGLVTDAQGDDIAPYAEASCSTLLPFELIAYDGTTGRFRAHVNVTSLSTTTNVFLCFQNAAQTTSLADVAGTWNSGFVGVWHLGDGSTCGLTDSKSSLTLTNTGTVGAQTGQIYGACGTNWATTPVYLKRADGAEIDAITSQITVSAWVFLTSYADYRIITCKSEAADVARHFCMLSEQTTGKLIVSITTGGTQTGATSTNAIPLSTWTHVAMTYNGSTLQPWINGVADGSGSSVTGALDTTNAVMTLGIFTANDSSFFNPWAGTIDELLLQNTARSAGWMLTEFNAGTPSTFWTVGSPTPVGMRRRMIIQ